MNITAKELKPGDQIMVKGTPRIVHHAGPSATNRNMIVITWWGDNGQLKFGRAEADTPITIQEGQ